MSTIASCSFPTTLLVLDDDQDLLENIRYALSINKYKCICTSDPFEAYQILDKNRGWTKSLLKKGISQVYQNNDPAFFSVSMDVSLLKKQVFNHDRFNNIAIAIVDFDMPKQNGLEFIRKLNDPHIKVIMLTGKATHNTVIQAFNKKEIHHYVSKGDPDYLKKVNQYISQLHAEFFFNFSKFILDSLGETENQIFTNPAFIRLFNKVVRENEITEYYLLDESGSFFMLDANANNQVWLIVKSKTDLQHFYELAQHDAQLPAETLHKLKDGKILTHFKEFNETLTSADTWRFLDAQPLDENGDFYYAIVKNDKYFELERSQIKPYQDFLTQRK